MSQREADVVNILKKNVAPPTAAHFLGEPAAEQKRPTKMIVTYLKAKDLHDTFQYFAEDRIKNI